MAEPTANQQLAVQRLLTADSLDSDAIDGFLKEHEFPLNEGSSTTFVYRGEADRVFLRHFIFGLPSRQPFLRIDETDLWYLTLALPRGSRIEYKIDVVVGDDHRWVSDPLNPEVAHDPFGSNSVCATPGYERPEWTMEDPEAREGFVEDIEVESRAFGDSRQVQVLLPPRFQAGRRHPLLIVHDGDDYKDYAALGTVLENLNYRLEIAPLIVALISSSDRLVEYAADERHSRFVAEELLPELEVRYPIEQRAAARGLMGASFGAVASLSTAWRYPEMFGRLLLQSGSFAFTDIGEHKRGKAFDPVVEFMNGFRASPGRPSEQIYMSCGQYESLIYENRSMLPLLQATGMKVRYTEARDGHNWENWRDRLRHGLSYLFPGPLWMVYE